MHTLRYFCGTALLLLLPSLGRAGVFDCSGDCNANREVTVDEIVTAVSVALGERPVADCTRADSGGDGQVTVDELLGAVHAALVGCGAADVLAENIQFIPDSTDVGGLRSQLLRVGDELVFNDGSATPIQAVHLPTRRVRPLVQHMGIPSGLAVRGDFVYWTEQRNGIAPSGCAGPGVIRLLQRTSLSQGTTTQLAYVDDCAETTGDVVLSTTHVYWASSKVSPPEYDLLRTPIAGGVSEVVYTASESMMRLLGDGTHVYWMERPFGPGVETRIQRLAFSGGDPEVVVGGLPMLAEPQGAFGLGEGSVVVASPRLDGKWDLLRAPSSGGATSVLAELTTAPTALTVNLGSAIWTDTSSLYAVPLAGGPLATLAGNLNGPVRLEAMADGVVWSETICCAHGQTGSVTAWRSDGTIVDISGSVDPPGPLAVDGARVYWGEGGPIGLIEGFGRIVERDLATGVTRDIAAGSSVPLPMMTSDGTYAYFVDRFRIKRVDLHGGVPQTWVREDFYVDAVAADQERLYWLVSPLSPVRSMPLGGGPITTLATSSSLAEHLRVAGGYVYWGDGLNTIKRVPVNGGTTQTVFTDIAGLADFWVDGTTLYVSEQDAGGIRRLTMGGVPEAFGFLLPFSWSHLAVNDRAVYWIDQENVYRRGKQEAEQRLVEGNLELPAYPEGGILADDEALYWTEVGSGRIRIHQP